jgi:aquaporin Z
MQRYLAEFLGTMFFVYTVLATENAFAACSALAVAMLFTMPISGGHLNPAISVVMAAQGRISTTEVMPYIISQIFGALIAIEVHRKIQL